MSDRRFTLPLTALSLTLSAAATTGCGANGLIGEWLLTDISVDGQDLSEALLEGDSYTYEGCTYTSAFAVSMEFKEKDGKEFSGDFEQSYTYTYEGDCGSSSDDSDSVSYDAEAEETDKNAYEIEVDDIDLDLACTLEDDELECEGESDDTTIDLIFERQSAD